MVVANEEVIEKCVRKKCAIRIQKTNSVRGKFVKGVRKHVSGNPIFVPRLLKIHMV